MKHFSILLFSLFWGLVANDAFAQSASIQEQDQPTQNHQRKMQRPTRQGKNRGARIRRKLAQMDTDQDQKISRDEWQRRPKAFDRLDANHDGFITREDITILRERRRKRNNPNATKPPANE